MQLKKTPVTLQKRGVQDSTTDVPYRYAYVKPIDAESGLMNEARGTAVAETTAVLYQEGECKAPEPDDVIKDSFDKLWVVLKVGTSLNYQDRWGVHNCTIRRTL